MSKIKVLAVFDRIQHPIGGAERSSLMLVKSLILGERRKEYEIILLCRLCDKLLIKKLGLRAKIINIPYLNRYPSLNVVIKVRRILRNVDVIYIPRMAFWITSLAKKLKKRTIIRLHDHFGICPFPHKVKIKKDQIIPCFTEPSFKKCLHCLLTYKKALLEMTKDTICSSQKLRIRISCLMDALFSTKYAKWVANADVITVASEAHKQYTQRILGKLCSNIHKKIIVIPNPRPEDITLIDESPIENAFTYVGGLNYVKGITFILRLINDFLGNDISPKIFVNTSIDRLLRLLIKKYKVGYIKRSRLLGTVIGEEKLSRSSVLRYMSRSKALLFPFLGFPNFISHTIMESVLLGRPFIAPNIGGIREYWSDYSKKELVLYEPFSYKDFKEKVIQLALMSRDEIYDIGLSLREYMLKKHRNEEIYEEFSRLFK